MYRFFFCIVWWLEFYYNYKSVRTVRVATAVAGAAAASLLRLYGLYELNWNTTCWIMQNLHITWQYVYCALSLLSVYVYNFFVSRIYWPRRGCMRALSTRIIIIYIFLVFPFYFLLFWTFICHTSRLIRFMCLMWFYTVGISICTFISFCFIFFRKIFFRLHRTII